MGLRQRQFGRLLSRSRQGPGSGRDTLPRVVQYVLIDASETVLASARANAELAGHGDRVQFVHATVQELQSYRDGSIDRIFCNELWSELPTKLLLRKAGDVMEEHIRPNLKETRLVDFPDWLGLVQAFDQTDIAGLKPLPAFLEDILWEREYHKIEAKDVPFRRLVTDFLKLFDEELLMPVNVGAAASLKEAHRLLAPDAIGFSSFDAGTADEAVLNDPEKPCYNLLGGQFSFMVNYALLEDVAKQVGEGRVTVEPQKEFIGKSLGVNVMSFMDVLASYPALPQGGPWEIDRLILKTIEAVNTGYTSPYERTIQLPLDPATPEETRRELEQLLARQAKHGVAGYRGLPHGRRSHACGRVDWRNWATTGAPSRPRSWPRRNPWIISISGWTRRKPSPLAGEGRVRGRGAKARSLLASCTRYGMAILNEAKNLFRVDFFIDCLH